MLSELSDYASRIYAEKGLRAEFWCAQSGESGLEAARRWRFGENVSGYCVDALEPAVRIPDSASACGAMLEIGAAGGTVRIARARWVRVREDGSACFYPELAGGGPSVFAASISYAGDGGSGVSYAVLPEGLVIGDG